MTIDNILKAGINDFVMVTGYRENMIKDFIAHKYPSLNIEYLTNSDYENNNNSYSLWMAKEKITSECILLDSDILFDYRIIEKILNSPHDTCLAVNTNHKLGEEEIKVIVDSTNKILHIGKALIPEKSYGESIGIERFSYDFFKKLGKVLDRKIIDEKNVNEFYEASFQELIDGGNGFFAVDVSEYKSMEIDTPEDLTRAKSEFLANLLKNGTF
jgi:choline kinase